VNSVSDAIISTGWFIAIPSTESRSPSSRVGDSAGPIAFKGQLKTDVDSAVDSWMLIGLRSRSLSTKYKRSLAFARKSKRTLVNRRKNRVSYRSRFPRRDSLPVVYRRHANCHRSTFSLSTRAIFQKGLEESQKPSEQLLDEFARENARNFKRKATRLDNWMLIRSN
jgi:hypothetical protein